MGQALFASVVTVAQLMGYCHAQNDPQTNQTCTLYIRGVVDGYVAATSIAKVPQMFCLPDGLTNGDLVVAVEKASKNQADAEGLGKLEAYALILVALGNAYPCP